MSLLASIEKAKEMTHHRCEKCGVLLKRIEYEEYGCCMNCVLERHDDDEER